MSRSNRRRVTDCPSHDQLAGLLNDAHSGAERTRLEAHLGDCTTCQRKIEDLAVEPTEWGAWGARMRDEHVSWPEQTFAGEDLADPEHWPVVPGYEVLDVLGRGGMGVVFKARQLALNRLVALKTLPLSGANHASLKKRLLREAETLARLHHPHVVQIFEILDVDGNVVLALELIHGGSLADRLRDSTLRPDEAARLVELLARTMQDAHDLDVLHRDLKPGNVLLTTDGIPKITDFGLARRVDAGNETRTGQILGTPSYLAPEQALGRQGWSTRSVDIYGLGAVLYECLTGRPPFRADCSYETMRQVVEEEPLSPSRLQPRLPRDLVTICLKCLRKDPARRYGSCRELADDLQRFQSGQPVQARRTSAFARAVKWGRRHPLVASLSLVCVVSLGALFGFWAKHTRDLAALNRDLRTETQRANDGQRAAEKAKAQADLQRHLAMGALMQTMSALQRGSRLDKGNGRKSTLMMQVPPETYEQVLAKFDYPRLRPVQARGYHWLGRQYLETGRHDAAVHFLERATQIVRFVEVKEGRNPAESQELGLYLADYGAALIGTNRNDEALKALREAVQIFSNPGSHALPETTTSRQEYLAMALFHLARAESAVTNYDRARELLTQALNLRDTVPAGRTTPRTAKLFSTIEKSLSSLPPDDPPAHR